MRVYSLLHQARPLLLNFGAHAPRDIELWNDRVVQVEATLDGSWELPVIGAIPPPQAVLIRLDGHVAWVGEGEELGLTEALAMWLG